MGNAAAIFLAPSGGGKSTLAASFSANGFRFLTDDSLQLKWIDEQYFVQPSHPSIRLWADSCEALIPGEISAVPPIDYIPKIRILAGEQVTYCDEPRPLKNLYFLGGEDTDSISITRVGGREWIIEMVRHSMLLDVEDAELLSRHFELLSCLANKFVIFRLNFPRRYEQLPDVRDAIVVHMGQGRNSATAPY